MYTLQRIQKGTIVPPEAKPEDGPIAELLEELLEPKGATIFMVDSKEYLLPELSPDFPVEEVVESFNQEVLKTLVEGGTPLDENDVTEDYDPLVRGEVLYTNEKGIH